MSDLTAEDDIDACENQIDLPLGEFPDFPGEQGTVEGYDLGDVGDRVPRKSSGLRRKEDIARGVRPPKIAGERDTDNGPDSAPVQGISLDYDDRPSKPGTRTRWLRQVCPIHVALGDYHSTRLSVRLAAPETAGSGRVSTVLHTRFMASVIASGSWRARYSSTASA